MQAPINSNPEKASQQAAIEQLNSAVVGLSAQRQHLRDYRQRAERSSLVNQALQAYRAYIRLQGESLAQSRTKKSLEYSRLFRFEA